VGIMAVIFAVRPWIMVPTLVLAVVFLVLRRFYMRSARDIKVYYHALIKKKKIFSSYIRKSRRERLKSPI
jgi:hypothetical protein